MPKSIDAAAAFLMDAHKNRQTYVSVAPLFDLETMEDAYDVQVAFVALKNQASGAKPIGHKIALTSKAMQEMCGVDRPLAGFVMDQVTHRNSAPAEATEIPVESFMHAGIEFELAVFVGADLVPIGRPYTGDDIAAHVTECLPAFEIVEDRHCDYAGIEALGLVADNSWNGAVVLGQVVGDWRDLDFADVPVTLEWSGLEPASSNTGEALGHPFNAVAWIANHLIARGEVLKAGEFVMTGSTLKTRFPEGDEAITYTIEGLGSVSLKLT